MALESDRVRKMSKNDAKSFLTHVIEIFITHHTDLLLQIDTSQCLDADLHRRILEIIEAA